MSRLAFTLSGTEIKNLEKWLRKHNKSCRFAPSEIPKDEDPLIGWARLAYKFTPTSIGCVIKVQCECGKEVDITDYEFW